MKDRFKFRVWDKENNKYINFEDWKRFDVEFNFNPETNEIWCEFDHNRYIVEQCTGLKDRNEKLIYEGDIIEDEYGCKYIVKFGKHTITIPVCYENGETECWGMYLSKFTYSFIYLQEQCDNLNPDNEYLIIGNIHENPELLEKENDKRKGYFQNGNNHFD